MKAYYLLALTLIFAASCSNNAKNKVDGADAQAVASAEGQALKVDLSQSSIHWTGFKVGGSHHGTLGIKSAELAINGTNIASGSFVLDMNNIIDEDLSDAKQKEMLVGHLKSADFFDVEKHPEGKFEITTVEPVTSNDSVTHRISGNLTLKGIEKNISFNALITKDGDVYKAVSQPFSINRTQWGVNYGSKSIFADLKDKAISDDMEIQLTIVAKAAQ
ncbi:YceI family protein [Dysgonomonas sp. ZJ709]|uniref:YceI family protein n=1 Tax=Dysgonomonas sp. ZJ709 TaxID=2709797 RepID=UPI0013EA89F0|nr:YceI family protein [Dysgonomonas sp. ZJ709]